MVQFTQHRTLEICSAALSIGIFLNYYIKGSSKLLLPLLLLLLVGFFLSKTRLFYALFGVLSSIVTGMYLIDLRIQASMISNTDSGIVLVEQMMSSNEYYNSYRVQLISQDNQKLLLKTKSSTTKKFIPGAQLSFKGTVKALHYPTHPGGFDYSDYLHKQGIYFELVNPTIITQSSQNTLFRTAYMLQQKLVDKLEHNFKAAREQTTAAALLIGYRDSGFKKLQEQYSDVGISHLLAISGLHTAVVFSLWYLLLWPLGFLPKGKLLRWIVAIVLLWGFALVSGWSHSVIRACLLLSFYGLFKLLNRTNNSFHFLFLALLTNLLINPFSLFQVGFQMSYLAVFFILWLYPLMRVKLCHSHQFIDKICQLVCLSLSAQIGVLPLILYYFGSFPIHFLLANTIVVPLMGVLIYLGMSSLFIVELAPIVERIFYYINEFILLISSDQMTVHLSIDWTELLLLYGISICLVLGVNFKHFRFLNTALISIIILQLYSFQKAYRIEQKELLLILPGAQQPQLIYKKGHQFQLYGDSTAYKRRIQELSSYYGIKKTIVFPFANAYKIHDYSVVHIAENSIYPKRQHTDLLLLSQNPKLHLERLIDSLQPSKILIDKNTAPWNRSRWKATAKAKKIPLIDLRLEGVYLIEF